MASASFLLQGPKVVIAALLAAVFLTFGVLMLVTSYHQNDPVVFLALFFSSSLIILLSLVIFLGIFLQWYGRNRPGAEPSEDTPEADD